jgi:hypothetical protein
MSSKPASAKSFGTERPPSRSAARQPIAIASLAAKIAVGAIRHARDLLARA